MEYDRVDIFRTLKFRRRPRWDERRSRVRMGPLSGKRPLFQIETPMGPNKREEVMS